MIKRLKNILFIFVIFNLLLSVFEFDHIFCKNINSILVSHNFIQEHEHSSCSHHCFDSVAVHHKHSKPHDCCDSEEPHDHPTQNPVVSFSDYSLNQLVFTFNSALDFTNKVINNSEILFQSLEVESSQLNSIKTVVLII